VRDKQGNLFGTTIQGSDLACNSGYGCGTVFKVDTTGNEPVLDAFTGGADGASPLRGFAARFQGQPVRYCVQWRLRLRHGVQADALIFQMINGARVLGELVTTTRLIRAFRQNQR
jgi:uncharacterized repeat protein (TIGR03803 family)